MAQDSRPPIRADRVARGRIVAAELRAGGRVPTPSPEVFERLVEALADAPLVNERDLDERKRRPLTVREQETLRLIAAGFENREIAELQQVGFQTVVSRVSVILWQLGARNRAHAVSIGVSRGLL